MRSVPCTAAVVVIGLATTLLPRVSGAEERPAARLVYLRGKGTETCPAEAAVREAVQVRLGYDPFLSYAGATMFAEIGAKGGGFTASLKLVDSESVVRGDRALHVEGSCAALIDAMALTMSIAIDPASATREGPVPGLPPVERSVSAPLPEAASEPDIAPIEDRLPSPTQGHEAIRLSASLGPVVSLGTAPGAAFGGIFETRAELGRWLVGVGVRGDLPASASADALGQGRVESSLLAGSLAAGVREGWVFTCLTGYLGRLSATSTNVSESRVQNALFFAAGLRVGLSIPLSARIEARGYVEILANLLRHSLAISGSQAYEYPVGSGNVATSIAVRFR